jgi:hypothetical protein
MLLSGNCFENPAIPKWLEVNLFISFQTKNKDHVKAYNKLLWEVLKNG